IDAVGATAAAVAQGAVPKQRADLAAAAQAFSARVADFQAQSATLVSDIGAVEPEVAAAVEAAEAAKSALDEARRSGQGDIDGLEAEAAAARDASAALLAEVRELGQRVSALSAHVVNLTAEVGLLQRAL